MIALIIGHGHLPQIIFRELSCDITAIVKINDGFDDYEWIPEKITCQKFNFGDVRKIIKFLHNNNIKKIIFAGYIKKPQISMIRTDLLGIKLLWKILSMKNRGDDGILKIIVKFLEGYRFDVLSIKDIIPKIFTDFGTINNVIYKQTYHDIELGINSLKTYGSDTFFLKTSVLPTL